MNSITPQDFCLALGEKELPESTSQTISAKSFRYSPLDEEESSRIILKIREEIRQHKFPVTGPQREKNWNDAWGEVLEAFKSSRFSLDSLNPKFLGRDTPLRFRQEFIRAEAPGFELSFFEVVRDWIFETYLADISTAYEFGSGSGFNLAAFSKKFPKKQIIGLDWSPASQDIAMLLGKKHGLNISGKRFNIFEPDTRFSLENNSAVLTFCALEQTGRDFNKFLCYLIKQRPKICIHMEPIEEFYDTSCPLDSLALEYHQSRKYLSGFYTRLLELEKMHKIGIIKAQRLFFGSTYHEGYCVLVWTPLSLSGL